MYTLFNIHRYCKWESDFKGSLNALNGVEIDQTVNSYIMTIKPRPLTIDMEKVKALGLKPGPVIGVLKKGICSINFSYFNKILKKSLLNRFDEFFSS